MLGCYRDRVHLGSVEVGCPKRTNCENPSHSDTSNPCSRIEQDLRHACQPRSRKLGRGGVECIEELHSYLEGGQRQALMKTWTVETGRRGYLAYAT
jgi:hypothetical protein